MMGSGSGQPVRKIYAIVYQKVTTSTMDFDGVQELLPEDATVVVPISWWDRLLKSESFVIFVLGVI